MTRQRSFAALGTAFLVPLLSACAVDSTGPDAGDDGDGGNEPTVVSDRIVVSLQRVEVAHDCDPATDNPGDFQSWVEVWQDADPSLSEVDFQMVASSARKTVLINSGEAPYLADDIQVSASVVRVRGRPVHARAYVRELDNGNLDSVGTPRELLQWWDDGICWQWNAVCMPSAGARKYREDWSTSVHTRDDEFIFLNPADEGCEFTVIHEAYITES